MDLNLLDTVITWAQVAVLVVCAIVAEGFARRFANAAYRILAGAFVCYALGNLFYNFYLLINDIYPYYLSVADLSWVSVYVFLTSACLFWLGRMPDEERRRLRRRRWPAVGIAAAAFVPAYAYMISWDPTSTVNNLLYGTTGILLTYFALWLLLGAWLDDVGRPLRAYHVAVLGLVIGQLVGMVSTCLPEPFYNGYYVVGALMIVLPAVMLWALRKGVTA